MDLLNGHRAGGCATRVAAHAIAENKDLEVGIDEIIVFVLCAL